LNWPGGNVTGVTNLFDALGSRQLEFMHALLVHIHPSCAPPIALRTGGRRPINGDALDRSRDAGSSQKAPDD
jgi:hypothetical protein